jgi:uncharacterized protein YndB with AHSA1/START domain
MTSPPTGRLVGSTASTASTGGADLIVHRTFKAPIDDVWASVTESERTARWFGRWEGEPGTGHTIKVQMAFEDNAPWTDMRIDVCEPPRRLAVTSSDENGTMRVELLLSHSDGVTELQLVQHMTSADGVGEMGPGWEYYLDNLVAAREDRPLPSFDDYYPAMKAYYEALPGS